ncbi:hypothetical protein [Streptomyces sp. NPDC015131]|uniref:hypothetical protein n=1 Tax=Streptomyces sp. NPDC015131 TaxID=3364941 RepID=UPI0036FC786C
MTSTRAKKTTGALACAALLAGAGTWIAVSAADGGPSRAAADSARPSKIMGHAKESLPSHTPEDWVSYGDHVAVVRVTSETAAPASAEEQEAGEGYLSRDVTMEVTDVLWSRAQAPALPGTVTTTVDGWSFKGDVRTPIAREGAARLEPGHSYVIALARFGNGEWSRIGTGAAMPYDSAKVGKGELEGDVIDVAAFRATASEEAASIADPTVEELTAGKSAQAVTQVLATAEPDPVAEDHFDLDPVARYAKAEGAGKAPTPYCAAAEPFDAASGGTLSAEELAAYLEVLVPSETGPVAADFTVMIAWFKGDTALEQEAGAAAPRVAERIKEQCGFTVRPLVPDAP